MFFFQALERNMSLSGQYLEELSRRYKKQVEEMQKAFEKKLNAVHEEIKKRDDREIKMQEQLTLLTESLNTILSERETFWKSITTIFGQFIFLVVFICCVLKYYGSRRTEDLVEKHPSKIVVKKRRKSIDTVGHDTPVVKKSRRPSEEALKITGTYEDLLIQDSDPNCPLTKAEKRRRRKKNALLRTQSIMEQKHKGISLVRSSSFDVNNVVRKQSAPAQMYANGDISPPVQIQEIPFALEESEHTSVEPLQVYDENQTNQTAVVKVGVKNGGVKPMILKSNPIFMKTALSSRNKRHSGKLSLFKTDKTNGKINEVDKNGKHDESSQRKSPDLSIASNNLSESTDDRSSVGSSSVKKEKKSSFRRLFKKVFE